VKRFWIVNLLAIFVFAWPSAQVSAQEPSPGALVYIVQSGDTLWSIAQRFGVSIDELAQANNISQDSYLKIGDRLVIPGLEGLEGTLETISVAYGDSLRSFSRRYQLPMDVLIRLNRLASPQELYVGANLVLLSEQESSGLLHLRTGVASGQSALELAVQHGLNPWSLLLANQLSGSWQMLPEDVLYLPAETSETTGAPSALPGIIDSVTLGLPAIQGSTLTLQIGAVQDLSVQGSFMGYPLNFFNIEDDQYVALQGIHALAEPGVYPLFLQVSDRQTIQFSFTQMIPVSEGGYPYDPVLYVDVATIDPQVTQPEDAQWSALTQPVTPEKLWKDEFVSPVSPEFSECWTSTYGNRRSYNDGPYNFFHTGLDFCGAVGNAIFAPAEGVVVFAGPLTVRGNATLINHGWGVYSGYMHQSEILVQVGDVVKPGQQIGMVGNTGRVNGPHLHWEIWVGGVQVDPLNWLQRVYP
jgi:murein DD-endopeptidase MepM/ murein hydrolase activator NlpD